MSALPPIATAKADTAPGHVCFDPKADVCSALADVGYGPIADIAHSLYSIRIADVGGRR